MMSPEAMKYGQIAFRSSLRRINGSTFKITYESPKIEKDNTFRDYLQYQQDRELRLDERAQAAKI